jgi:hypothetical protein
MKTPSIYMLTFIFLFVVALSFAAQDKPQPEAKPVTAAGTPILTNEQKNALSETYIEILENAQQMTAKGCNDLNAKQQAMSQKLQQLQAMYCPPNGSKLFHLDHTAPTDGKPAEWSCKETVQPPQPAKTVVPAAPPKK